MHNLVPGYVPPGWTRGDPISCSIAPTGGYGRIYCTGSPTVDKFHAIAAIDYHYSQREYVKSWWDWWHNLPHTM